MLYQKFLTGNWFGQVSVNIVSGLLEAVSHETTYGIKGVVGYLKTNFGRRTDEGILA